MDKLKMQIENKDLIKKDLENVKYIILDLDGTALNPQKEFNQILLDKVGELQKQGYKLIICSGRVINGLAKKINQLQLNKYDGFVLSANGGTIYKFEDMEAKCLKEFHFSKEQCQQIVDIVEDRVGLVITYSPGTINTNNIKNELLQYAAKDSDLIVKEDYIVKTPKVELWLTEDASNQGMTDEEYQKLRDDINALDFDLNVFSSSHGSLEITPINSNKGQALQYISKEYKIPNNQFICFGDEENDVSMFNFIENCVAMGNGRDFIKKLGKYETKTNKEDGVHYFLDIYLDENKVID